MSEDKRVKKYFENMPYGNDAKSSEIHGKASQQVANGFIATLVENYDKNIEEGNKDMAAHFYGAIKQIAWDFDNAKEIKKEFGVNYGGGVGGKKLFSAYTDLRFDRSWVLEDATLSFDDNMRPVWTVITPEGEEITKRTEDITENWVVRGDEENQYMKLQQDAVKQRNTMGESIDFDIDWTVDNMLANNDAWKIFASDKIGGRYFLHDYLQENQEAVQNGEIPDEMLHPDSFNPDFDTRLHQHYSNRLKRAFDENYQTPAEARKADELIARTNPQDNTENNQV